jgi:hypothetical protein
MRLAAAVMVLVSANAARANSISEEVLFNSAQTTQSNPRAKLLTNALNGFFELTEDVGVGLGANVTFEGPTPGQFGGSGGVVTLFTLSSDWAVTDNLTLGAGANLSPASTQYAGTVIGLRSGGTDTFADAQLRSQSSQAGGGFSLAWDTLGKSDLEWSFDASIDFSHYDVDQEISQVQTSLTPTQVRTQAAAFCTAHPRRPECARGLQGAVALDFERFSGAVLATIFTDTDVSLSADWYLYNEDPAAIGFFGVASQGRGPGLPIAPLQYLLRPEGMHRFGEFSARLFLEGGEYVSGTGGTTFGAGVRLQYRFTKAWRAWLTLSGHRDVDVNDNTIPSGTVSAGAGYRW